MIKLYNILQEVKINKPSPINKYKDEIYQEIMTSITDMLHGGDYNNNKNISLLMLDDSVINDIVINYIKSKMIEDEAEIIRNKEIELVDSSNIDTITDEEIREYLEDNKYIQSYLSKIYWDYYFNNVLDLKYLKDKVFSQENKYGTDLRYYVDHILTDEIPYPDDIIDEKFKEYLYNKLEGDNKLEEVIINKPFNIPKGGEWIKNLN